MVTATVDIVQLYSVVYGDYCGYSSSRYCAMVLGFLWSLLSLKQQSFSAMLLRFVCSLLLLQHQNL